MPFLAPVLVGMGSFGAAVGAGLGATAGALGAIGGGSALAGAGLVGLAGASIVGAGKAGEAARAGTRAQVQAGQQALDVQLQIFREQQAAQEPFRQIGLGATNKLAALFGVPQATGQQQVQAQPTQQQTPQLPGLLGQLQARGGLPSGTRQVAGGQITPEVAQPSIEQAQQEAFGQFQTSPGFEFRQQQAQQAVERGAAARGGLLSGKGLRGVTQVSQDIASQEFGNYVGALQSLAGLGPTATTQQNIAGQQFAGRQTGTLQNIGAARASGFAAQNQAFQTGLQGVSNVFGFGLGLGGT